MQESIAIDEGLFYTTVEGFSLWVSKNFAGILSSDKPNDVTINGDKIKEALFGAESLVDGYLSNGSYIVPISSESRRSIYLLRIICYSIAAYELYSSKGVNTEQYYKYSQTIKQLEKISSGEIVLVDAVRSLDSIPSGALFSSDYFSSSSNYNKGADI